MRRFVVSLTIALMVAASCSTTEPEAGSGSTDRSLAFSPPSSTAGGNPPVGRGPGDGGGFGSDGGAQPGDSGGSRPGFSGDRPGFGGDDFSSFAESALTVDAEPPAELAGRLPVLFFLFTHTEDPFNHELSEERYTRLVPVVEEIAGEHPDAHLSWTVMFQESDALTVAERNAETGVVDLLRSTERSGLIDFGYHAHHDPTYDNRPQNGFDAETSWADLVAGMDEWVSCRKDLLHGGCVEPGGGGLLAIEASVGDVAIASGLFSAGFVEGGAGVHAYRHYDGERRLGFGFPDHGPIITTGAWSGPLPVLEELLAPAWDTSPSLIWMDDILRINGGIPSEGLTGVNTLDGPAEIAEQLGSMSRDRVGFFNAGFASKYLYTAEGTSPTIHGYANPDSPELTDDLLLDRDDIEEAYATSGDSVRYLAGDFIPANPGSRFVDSQWILDHVAPPGYFVVSRRQIERMASWIEANWDDAPPVWVYDGLDYYSLRDALVLMSAAVANPDRDTFDLLPALGPVGDPGQPAPATAVSTAELEAIAEEITTGVETAAGEEWRVTPANLLPTRHGPAELSTAQVLHGLAQLITSAGTATAGSVDIPAAEPMPASFGLLQSMECPTCYGSAWSLKPARIRLDG